MAMKPFSPARILVSAVSVALLVLYFSVWLSFAGSPTARRSDFLIYYTAGRLPLNKLYNLDAQREVQTRLLGAPLPVAGELLPFNHTPVFVPLLHLLINDDYAASYRRWTVLLWLVALSCVLLIFKISGDFALAVAAASFYPLFTYVQQGHDTVFLLFGILLGAYLLSLRKDWLAGVALSLATLKPHLAIFLAVPLTVRPRAWLAFCTASFGLALYSALLVGSHGVAEFLALLRISAGGEVFGVRPETMFNLLGLMERAGVSAHTARPIAWTIFLLTSVALLLVWKRRPAKAPIALTIVLAIFTSPHLMGHDLALLLVSFATLARPRPLFLLASSLVFVGLSGTSNNWQYAAAYILMIALFTMAVREFAAEARAYELNCE
jgi:hypothetical protein